MKNNNITNTEKLELIKKFIEDKKEFNNLTDLQLKNFIYRHIESKKLSPFDMLLKHNEIIDILKNNDMKNNEKLEMIKKFTEENEEFKNLTLQQIKNFIYRTNYNQKI